MEFNEVNPDCFNIFDEVLPYLMIISFIFGYFLLRNLEEKLDHKNIKKEKNLNFFVKNNFIHDYKDLDKEIN
jgi:hypothetical protein